MSGGGACLEGGELLDGVAGLQGDVVQAKVLQASHSCQLDQVLRLQREIQQVQRADLHQLSALALTHVQQGSACSSAASQCSSGVGPMRWQADIRQHAGWLGSSHEAAEEGT